jgi:hypothetical protein
MLQCRHCGGEFRAQSAAGNQPVVNDSTADMLKRADELLDATQETVDQPPRRRPR